VRITARDGVVVPAYLTLPRTGGIGPQPAVVFVHGGPWARDEWGYNSYAQFLANRGYAVLQPNFRGSTGYGKKFLNLGNGQWGTGTMQHDLTDVAAWLVKQGHAAPGKVAIMGGSYGGYATLAGLAFTPDVWAAGVDIVGPSSIVTLLNSIPPYWTPIRKMFAVRVGDVEKPADVERLQAQSPLHSAKQMKAPLLVIQGANDPRVKQAEADQIVMALRDLGRPIEYLVAPDEGHGFRGRENRLAMLASIERFLAKHLGGRAQSTVPPEVEQRLAALTVDPASVRLADSAPPAPAPVFSAKSMKPVELRYRMIGKLGGQPIEGSSVVSVTKSAPTKGAASTKGASSATGGWSVSVTDRLEPLGESTDVTALDPKTLLPLSRTMKQGPTTVAFQYAGTAVKGTIESQGRQLPFEGKGTAVLVPDGAAMGVALATLPLNHGYRATMSTFDFGSGKVAELRVAVTSAEKVSVPAGSFDTWKVEVSQDGRTTSTLWFEKAKSRRMVKAQLMLPAGQGELAQELTK
jgi:dienelactone hydrolase